MPGKPLLHGPNHLHSRPVQLAFFHDRSSLLKMGSSLSFQLVLRVSTSQRGIPASMLPLLTRLLRTLLGTPAMPWRAGYAHQLEGRERLQGYPAATCPPGATSRQVGSSDHPWGSGAPSA